MNIAQQHIVGSSETIGFPSFGMSNVPAKIDTGADSGAIHCTTITEKNIKGKSVIQFSPFDEPDHVIIATDYTVRKVRSSNGEACERFFIDTIIEIQGKQYPINLSLADRTEMTWPVLVGKKFLADNNFLVDVTRETQVVWTQKEQS